MGVFTEEMGISAEEIRFSSEETGIYAEEKSGIYAALYFKVEYCM